MALKPAGQLGRQLLGAVRHARGGRAQARQDIFDPFGFQNIDGQARPNELRRTHVREQRK